MAKSQGTDAIGDSCTACTTDDLATRTRVTATRLYAQVLRVSADLEEPDSIVTDDDLDDLRADLNDAIQLLDTVESQQT